MASIPRDAIKRLVEKYMHAQITDEGADAMAKILEAKAQSIAKFAVKNAKKAKRRKVTKEDIEQYIFKKDADI
ncbi:MAG: histone-like protein [Candidatus Micrarchaeia archaeon]